MLDSSSFSQNNGLTLKRAGQTLCFIDQILQTIQSSIAATASMT